MDRIEIILSIIALTTGLIAILLSLKKRKTMETQTCNTDETDSLLIPKYDWRIYSLEPNGNIVNSISVPSDVTANFTIGSSRTDSFRLIIGDKVKKNHACIEQNGKTEELVAASATGKLYHKGHSVLRIPLKHKKIVWLGDSPVLLAKNHINVSPRECRALLARDIRRYGYPQNR